jgi:hypothetical protein
MDGRRQGHQCSKGENKQYVPIADRPIALYDDGTNLLMQ